MELAEGVSLLLLIYFLCFKTSLAPSLGRSHPFHRRLELCCVAAPHRPAERLVRGPEAAQSYTKAR